MRLTVEERAARAVRRGHPWVFRETIVHKRGARPELADSVELADEKGNVIARGLFDPDSPIAVRVYALGPGPAIDAQSICVQLAVAFARRDGLFVLNETTALRLCNGEGDRVPGLVIDRYQHVAVARADGAAMAARLPEILPRLRALLEPHGITTLLVRDPAARQGQEKTQLAWGRPAPDSLDVLEHGVVLEVDLLQGQKTGAFLDQRENRHRVQLLAQGRARVLNLFSYTGGFSVCAALGGASEVTSVDVAAPAHKTAQRIFQKNGLEPREHRFITADATRFVETELARGARYDLVISDPPSFARSEKNVDRALGSYSKLHRSCAGLLAPGGLFCAASCSSHVSMERFLTTLDDAALGRSDLVVRGMFAGAEDHPTPAVFAEGRYLKFVVMG